MTVVACGVVGLACGVVRVGCPAGAAGVVAAAAHPLMTQATATNMTLMARSGVRKGRLTLF
jgi:hypothetical protein